MKIEQPSKSTSTKSITRASVFRSRTDLSQRHSVDHRCVHVEVQRMLILRNDVMLEERMLECTGGTAQQENTHERCHEGQCARKPAQQA